MTGAPPPQLALDQLQAREQLPGREICLDCRGPVQEAGLIEEVHRIGLAQLRGGDELDARLGGETLERELQHLLAIAEIGAESHIGSGHALDPSRVS